MPLACGNIMTFMSGNYTRIVRAQRAESVRNNMAVLRFTLNHRRPLGLLSYLVSDRSMANVVLLVLLVSSNSYTTHLVTVAQFIYHPPLFIFLVILL